MKIKLLVAVLLLPVAPMVAQCNFSDSGGYHGYVFVASATISNWNGCTGTLNVVVANDTPYWDIRWSNLLYADRV